MKLFFWDDGNCITCGISSLAVMRLRSEPRSHRGEFVDKGQLDDVYLCGINRTVTKVINKGGIGLGGSSRLCCLGSGLVGDGPRERFLIEIPEWEGQKLQSSYNVFQKPSKLAE